MPYRIFAFVLFALLSVNLSANDEIKRIDTLVNDIVKLRKSYEEQLAQKEKKIVMLEKENNSYKEELRMLKKKKNSPQCNKEQENPFPHLLLTKEQKDKYNAIRQTEAFTYRFIKDAPLYKGYDTQVIIANWEKGRSFTSNMRTQSRIKITGYFVNKIWKKANKDMWVAVDNIIKR